MKIAGLDDFKLLRTNVEATLRIKRAEKRDDTRPRTLRRLHRGANEEIREALRPYGYYEPDIVSEISETDSGYAVRYTVVPGPETKVRNIDVQVEGTGAEEPEVREARNTAPLRAGERLVHPEYKRAKGALKQAAVGRGYLDAEYTASELRVNPDERWADVLLHLKTGEPYTFGPVRIEQDILHDDFVRRYVNIEPGERFDPQRLIDLQIRLSDLGYFGSVQVDTERKPISDQTAQAGDTPSVPDTAPDVNVDTPAATEAERYTIPVVAFTQPLKPQRYRMGAGYGTDTGARGSLEAVFRYLNRSGHTLNLQLQPSEVLNTASATYAIPVGNAPGEAVRLTGRYEDEILEDGERSTSILGVSRNWTLGAWFRSLYLNFINEQFRFDQDRESTILLTPGISLSRTELSDPVYARRGWSIFFDVHGAARDVLSDTSFVQSSVQLRSVVPLLEDMRLLLRTELGATSVEDFSQLPASERFFAGGDQSVRGYSFESLAPRDDDDNVIGGEYLFTGSTEFEHIVWKGLGYAVFADIGNATNEPFADLAVGAGAGIRFRSPVGVIQLDLAHPFDDPGTAVRLHLGIRAGL